MVTRVYHLRSLLCSFKLSMLCNFRADSKTIDTQAQLVTAHWIPRTPPPIGLFAICNSVFNRIGDWERDFIYKEGERKSQRSLYVYVEPVN